MVGFMRIGLPTRYARTTVLAMAMLAAPFTALADATAPYYERSFVLAADAKCRLFAPAVTTALTASTWQARGAAARAGASDVALAETAGRARASAAQTACADPELATVRTRVSTAFNGWSRMARMTFPGGRAAWIANRSEFSSATWRLMQTARVGASPVTFGYVEGGAERQTLKAVVSFVGHSRPYAARVVMRDVERAPHPYMTSADVAAMPPEATRRAFFAAGNLPADKGLLQPEKTQGEAWIFPADTADALARLDPREPFAVEFMFSDGSVARATFEAGDFAAGRAFIAMGSL
jgi:hypothetical protein